MLSILYDRPSARRVSGVTVKEEKAEGLTSRHVSMIFPVHDLG